LGIDLGAYKVKPSDGNSDRISVNVPAGKTIIAVRGLMRNEIWGGAAKPPKPNTDGLGSIDFKPCPLGTGDCPIAWSQVSEYRTVLEANGTTTVFAEFRNWAGRNDRWAKLEVTFN
jgi:hypothetical protein